MKVKTKQWGNVQIKSFNPLSAKSFWSSKYLVWSVFPLLLGASTGNFSQRCFHQFSWGSWLWPHPLISEHPLVRALWPVNTPSDRKVPTVPEMKPEERFLCSFVYKKKEKLPSQCQPMPFYSQPRQLPCSTMATHLPLFHPFLLAQNQSSKWIALCNLYVISL